MKGHDLKQTLEVFLTLMKWETCKNSVNYHINEV